MLTPFMGLTLPTPTVTIGPTWAEELNAAFDLVDAHDHTTGKGVQVPSAGININGDLSFNTLYNQTDLRSLRFAEQAVPLAEPTDLQCLYSVLGNLYYTDGDGNQVRVTLNGALDTSTSGSISGMGATTASVTYTAVGTKFTFLSNTAVPAIIAAGPYRLSPIADNTFGITLTAPTLAASYSLTLPDAPPASTKIMRMDLSGNISASLDADNSTLEISTNTLQIKDLGVTTAKIANSNVTAAKIVSNPTFEGTNFGSAGSSVQIYGSGSGYNLANAAARTLLQSYSGTSGKGYRILCGRVTSAGGVSFGEGFSVSHPSTGRYGVNPTIAGVTDTVACVAIPYNTTSLYATVASVSTSSADVRIQSAASDTPTNSDFLFIMMVRVA